VDVIEIELDSTFNKGTAQVFLNHASVVFATLKVKIGFHFKQARSLFPTPLDRGERNAQAARAMLTV
jgi:hypothetical protein